MKKINYLLLIFPFILTSCGEDSRFVYHDIKEDNYSKETTFDIFKDAFNLDENLSNRSFEIKYKGSESSDRKLKNNKDENIFFSNSVYNISLNSRYSSKDIYGYINHEIYAKTEEYDRNEYNNAFLGIDFKHEYYKYDDNNLAELYLDDNEYVLREEKLDNMHQNVLERVTENADYENQIISEYEDADTLKKQNYKFYKDGNLISGVYKQIIEKDQIDVNSNITGKIKSDLTIIEQISIEENQIKLFKKNIIKEEISFSSDDKYLDIYVSNGYSFVSYEEACILSIIEFKDIYVPTIDFSSLIKKNS